MPHVASETFKTKDGEARRGDVVELDEEEAKKNRGKVRRVMMGTVRHSRRTHARRPD